MPGKQRTVRQCERWILLIWLGAALTLPIPANGNALTLDEVIAKAKEEGDVRLGIAVRKQRGGRVMAPRVIGAFQKRYPFIKVKYKRIGGFRVRERVFSEMVGGVINYDVASLSTRQVADGIKANIFHRLAWRGFGVEPDAIHPTNAGVTYRMAPFGIAYNRDLIKEEEGQRLTWEDCTNPKWKGKFATVDRVRHLEVLYQDNAWGREKTLDYARRLAANDPMIERSRSEATLKLAAGAYAFLCGERWQGLMLQRAYGAENLGITFPEPVPIVHVTLLFVPRGAKNPNAGILWILWTLSEEGQKVYDEVEFSGNPNLPASSVHNVLKGKQIIPIDWKYLSRSDKILREILTEMGFPIVR